jgi:hypothetical protein
MPVHAAYGKFLFGYSYQLMIVEFNFIQIRGYMSENPYCSPTKRHTQKIISPIKPDLG